MLYTNAEVFNTGLRRFEKGGFYVKDDRFADPASAPADEPVTDLGGKKVIPGLIDIHTHGAMGEDLSECSYEGLVKMAKYYADNGIAFFCPANLTVPYEQLERAYANALRLTKEKPEGCAEIAGINMEGPYFSEKRKGSQNAKYLKKPDYEGFKKLYDGCEGLIRICDVAPELPGAEEFISMVSKLCTVSVAHTDATYEEAAAGFDAGATHLTHLFNAMPALHHRNPGVIAAAAERENVHVELICDGLHVHPAMVRLAFRLFGPDRICIISDSLCCCGMPDGVYGHGGQDIILKDNIARLRDGTIAGSASNVKQEVLNCVEFGIPLEDAVIAATLTPAKAIGMENEIGSIDIGKKAAFTVLDI